METHELIALKKALFFIKFGNDETEKSFLAGSPIINKLLEDAHNSLLEYYQKIRPGYSGEWGWIEEKTDLLNAVIEHIKNIEERNWSQLTIEIKHEVVKNLCFPFKVTNNTLEKIISDRTDRKSHVQIR